MSATAPLVTALDTSQVRNAGIIAILGVILLGLLIAWFVTKMVTRIIVLGIVVVLGFALYNQRSKALDAASNAANKCDATFFGVHVQPSDQNIKKACAALHPS